jgi:hypothetical protein
VVEFEAIEHGQARLGSLDFGDGDGPVQLDDRGAGLAGERVARSMAPTVSPWGTLSARSRMLVARSCPVSDTSFVAVVQRLLMVTAL